MGPTHWLIIGCGYVGSRVARAVVESGGSVTAVTRSAERADELHQIGIAPVLADVTRPDSLGALPVADVWLHAVAYDRASPLPRRAVTVDGFRSVLNLAADRTREFIHISTASVYGTADGSWVDEQTTCEPTTEAGQLALEAEQLVAQYNERFATEAADMKPQATTLRLTGIYGPGRLIARIDQLREQTLLPGLGESWLNLIHVDDVVQVIRRVAEVEQAKSLYLVSDDQPITRREFYREVARLTGSPLPRFAGDVPSGGADDAKAAIVSNGRTQGLNKRCRNGKIREELGIELIHPTIYSGLPASLEM